MFKFEQIKNNREEENGGKNKDAVDKMTRRDFLKKLGVVVAAASVPKIAYEIFSDGGEKNIYEDSIKEFSGSISFEGKRGILKEKPSFIEAKERVILDIKNLHLSGKVYKYGVTGKTEKEALMGRFQRALRYREITRTIEERYHLPEDIIFAMMIQESNGRDILLNALGDGGAGLCHMQPVIAREFGLKTLETNGKLVDKRHGKKLLELTKKYQENPIELSHFDDRFNPLINLDAVARMLTYYIHGKKIEGLGRMRTAIRRYAGSYNYKKYWEKLRFYMEKIHNEEFLKELREDFNKHNQSLEVNGVRSEDPFSMYIEQMQKANWENYGLDFYLKHNPEYRETEELALINKTISHFL